jgi:outer membrane protein TolC
MNYLTWITKIGLVLVFLMTGEVYSQVKGMKAFSLKEAQEYGVQNAYAIRNATTDLSIAKKKIMETTAIGLPQISASLQYQDMLDIPTTLLPDFITPAIIAVNEGLYGLTKVNPAPSTQYFPAKFGTQHNATVGGTLSQLIFSGEYIVGLQASRAFYQSSAQAFQKTEIETRSTIAQNYYLVLMLAETKRILGDQTSAFEKTVYETDEALKNGLIEDITVDQLKINLQNLKNTVTSMDRNIQNAKNLLKFQMGMDISEEIVLKDSLPSLLSQIVAEVIPPAEFRLSNHIDYKMMETNEKLLLLSYKREQSTYLPTLAAFFTYQKRAMRNEFDIFKKGEWYPTSIIGLNMEIPIFSSGMKHFKVQQARLALEKMKVSKEQVGQALKMGAENARSNYNNAVEKFITEKQNKELSSNIYKKTMIKFKEGISSSTELTQIQSQYLGSLTNYYSAVYDMLTAKTNYDKAINNY